MNISDEIIPGILFCSRHKLVEAKWEMRYPMLQTRLLCDSDKGINLAKVVPEAGMSGGDPLRISQS